MSEDKIHSECYLWFHNTYHEYRDLLWHTPNGGARNKIEAAKFKAMGVRPGIPDFLFLFLGKLHEIEIKEPTKGTISDDQKRVTIKHRQHGALYYICTSLEQFQHVILSILNHG